MADDATVRLTDDGPSRVRAGGKTFVRGEETATNADHADYLASEFDHFERVDAADDDGPECADENCSRDVDEAGETCWQHGDDE